MRRRRVAIITPWYGEECTGGAELHAVAIAEGLARFDDVTILTTTSRSFLHDWDIDYHKAGKTRAGTYDVLRFKVRPRDREVFGKLNGELLAMAREQWPGIATKRERYDAFIEESINSPDLEDHLARSASSLYDAVLFLPYLYGVIVRGIEAYPGRAHQVPCLHDEAYARIPRIEDAFHKSGTLLFNSAGEAELALRLYGPGVLAKSIVMGGGISEAPAASSAALTIRKPYFVYVGRREPEKGLDMLVDVFRHYHSNGSAPASSLVLAGPGERSYEDRSAGIVDLGFVDEATKVTLLRDAVALLNPSPNESYSRVLMEAWRERIPVVAHESCLATATAVRDAGGGFVAGTDAEWLAVLQQLETMDEPARRTLGERGAGYAAEHADWDKTIARLRAAIGDTVPATPQSNGKRIDQVLEGFDDGDAISDYARRIRHRLEQQGYASTIYALNVPPGVEDAQMLGKRSLGGSDAVIYHHSIGSKAAESVLAAACRKAIVHHNVTPASYFAPYAPTVAQQLDHGRAQLAAIVRDFDVLVADSDYNGSELIELGAKSVRTIPVAGDFRRLDCSPTERHLSLARGTTWLFVGRVMPNKGLRALIEAFEAYLALDDDAHLIIVGKYDRGDRFYADLRAFALERRIDPYVTFTGYADEPALVAYYRSADVFVTLSEHEGFCVPLVEAMFFDVPIVAKATTAIPGTLGHAGLLLEPSAGPLDVAATVHAVASDDLLRARIIAAQRERRRAFLPESIDPLIEALAADLIAKSA